GMLDMISQFVATGADFGLTADHQPFGIAAFTGSSWFENAVLAI
ncbi:1281_t:CDS:1, partial [Racocetra persica]